MKLIYGPVYSWRLGLSLGIDLIATDDKICSFDCIYCQLERTNRKTIERSKFVDEGIIKGELPIAIKQSEQETITFSGMGEPTLASNLEEAVEIVREITNLPIAILTNSSFFHIKEVRSALLEFDRVVAKLDAHNESLFQEINRPHHSISFDSILKWLKIFRDAYEGRFELQMMFIDANKGYAREMAEIAFEIKPDEVQVNTPLRTCPVNPLSKEEIEEIKGVFEEEGLNVVSVYDAKKKRVKPLEIEEVLRRRKDV
ncbi:MAG: radical SAM protein [archaeon]|nr:radical SAM protein [archaeon]